MRRRFGAAIATVALLVPLIAAARASADGTGVIGLPAGHGIAAPGGAAYSTVTTGDGTVFVRIDRDVDGIARSRFTRDDLMVPAVAYDGSGGMASSTPETFVAVPSTGRFPPRRSTFLILDGERLKVRDRITVPGAFSFDAISPDGSRLYLIEYPKPPATTEYQVRAYDLQSRRLLAEPIVDPDEPPGEMQGTPMTRATSPDGRWAYTLYDGDEHPFIHALDTVEGRAVCIDLHDVEPNGVYRSTLAVRSDGSELTVTDRKHGPVALVDTASFDVSEPAVPSEGGSFPWLEVILVPLGATAGWALFRGLRRRRPATGGAR